uniref:Nudix hydrolase domain-containing protein n=1 Tax=Strigamia maritima TaxID=126957 RepID=T1JA82_STRMM
MDSTKLEEDTCSKCLKTEVIGTGNWLELGKITYENSKGKERTWESFNRITRPKTSDTDSVSILAILKRTLRRDCYILVSKFRPPVNAFTIELPSGLIKEGETPANAALRQFQVETGYVGIVKFVGPPLAVDPGLSNTTMRIVTVEIDGDNAANLRQEKRSEDQDIIKVHRVPVSDLLEKLIGTKSEKD